ncbi:MAG: hypothetical protein LBI43_07080 [Streptococcaceae bacterium]|jgi:hypothetical protein|nr:hypothetical protein [Streptococcaceae bacterium]
MKGIVSGGTASWLGAEIEIKSDGSLTVNGKENYSSEELYTRSKKDYNGAIKMKEK